MKPDSNKIISVYRTRIDDCDRMWFVDTGSLQYSKSQKRNFFLFQSDSVLFIVIPGKAIQVQRPSIWIVNMTTEQIILRFEIPEHIVEKGHGLISLRVDVKRNFCDDVYTYIPDLLNHRIHVYR